MNYTSPNGIINAEEIAEVKARSVRLRFMQVLTYGLGGATVFGLVTAIASKLLPLALGAAGAVSIPAVIGLGAIALLGVGGLYLSASYLSETTLMEQDLQAKKIGIATRGHVPTVATPQPVVAVTTLPSMQSQQEHDTIEKRWADRFGPAADSAVKAPAPRDNHWAEQAMNDDKQPTSQARA